MNNLSNYIWLSKRASQFQTLTIHISRAYKHKLSFIIVYGISKNMTKVTNVLKARSIFLNAFLFCCLFQSTYFQFIVFLPLTFSLIPIFKFISLALMSCFNGAFFFMVNKISAQNRLTKKEKKNVLCNFFMSSHFNALRLYQLYYHRKMSLALKKSKIHFFSQPIVEVQIIQMFHFIFFGIHI